MNSNKVYDRYGFAKFFLLADLILGLIGVVILCVLGFNVTSNQGGHLILQSTLSVLISALAIFLYVGFRYNFAKALAVLLVIIHNVLLSTALICLIRVPVSETITMCLALLVGLSAIFALVLIEKTNKIDFKKADLNEEIRKSINKNFKLILAFSVVMIAVMLLTLTFASTSIFDFAREFFVMMIVLLYGTFVLTLPIYFFIAKRTKKKAKFVVDSSVENQKVAKAAIVEEKEETEQAENLVEKDL